MACKIKNVSKNPVRLDLRGGEILVLRPGQETVPLRDEALYGNAHVGDWVKQGILECRKVPMQEVIERENGALLDRADNVAAVKSLIEVEGLGKKKAQALVPMGIHDIGGLVALDVETLQKLLGVTEKRARTIMADARERVARRDHLPALRLLTEVKEIGPELALDLVVRGVHDLEGLIDLGPEGLEALDGIGEKTAREILADAGKLLKKKS